VAEKVHDNIGDSAWRDVSGSRKLKHKDDRSQECFKGCWFTGGWVHGWEVQEAGRMLAMLRGGTVALRNESGRYRMV